MAESSFYEKYFNKADIDQPYHTAKEYLSDLLYILDLCIRIATTENVSESSHSFYSDIEEMDSHISMRLARGKEENRLSYIINTLRLTDFEIFCLAAALACGFNKEYGDIFAQLQNSNSERLPTKGLIICLYRLVYITDDLSLMYFLTDETALCKYCLDTKDNTGSYTDRLIPDYYIGIYLFYENCHFVPKMNDVTFYPYEQEQTALLVRRHIAEEVQQAMCMYEKDTSTIGRMISGRLTTEHLTTDRLTTSRLTIGPLLIQLYGSKGSGRHFLVKKIIETYDKSVRRNIIFYNISNLSYMNKNESERTICKLLMYSVLSQSAICLTLEHLPEDAAHENIITNILEYITSPNQLTQSFPFIFFIAKEETEQLLRRCRNMLRFQVPMLTLNEKITLWKTFSSDYPVDGELDIGAVASKYILMPRGIHNILHTSLLCAYSQCRETITRQDISQAVKQRQRNRLGSYASQIHTVFTWEDFVLEAKQKEMLRLICNQIKYRAVVGEDWGFFDKLPYGRGISVLFYGPPGTGKTMGAQVIANELGLDLYRIDLSQIVSKYIGETEKNISELFEKAGNINAILLFDEADALFAKRSEIRDSNDRSANSTTAHLLQKMEDYDGIAILATNLIQNMDDAFKRRMKYIVQFAFPEKEARLHLFQSIFPKKAVCDETLDFEFFSEHFELSGSSIKEVLINAAYMAVGEGTGIRNRHIAKSIKLNYMKYGKLITEQELEYFD